MRPVGAIIVAKGTRSSVCPSMSIVSLLKANGQTSVKLTAEELIEKNADARGVVQ